MAGRSRTGQVGLGVSQMRRLTCCWERGWRRSRTGGLGVRKDIENVPALQEGGDWTQRQGAVRRQAWTASCCLAAEPRGRRSNLVVVGEARIERAQWEYPFRTGTVRLTWWLEGRVFFFFLVKQFLNIEYIA